MEHGSDKKTSEKDSRMASSFESYSDSNESKESKEDTNKKKKRGLQSEKRSEETEEQKKPEAFEKSEKQGTSEKKDELSSLFEKKEESDELDLSTIEEEPELPENPEEISDDEMQVIARQLLDAHEAQLHEELAEAEEDSPEEAAVLAKAMLVEDLQESVGKEPPNEAALASAVDRIADELDIKPESEEEYDAVAEAENILRQATSETETDQTIELAESNEATDDDSEDDKTSLSPTSQSVSTPLAHSGSSGSGGGISVGPPGVGGGGIGAAGVSSPNSMPMNPNISQSSEVSSESRYRRGADMLVGGIIGYLIGRRRGRIKTEQRLEPIQKSLEKKVGDLHEKLIISEEKVGKLASEKVAREGEDARKAIAERVEAKARAKFEAKQAAKAAAKQESQTPEPMAEVPNQAPEIGDTVSESGPTERRPERLASVLLSKTELVVPENRELTIMAAKEAVQKMPERELLVIAAKIEIGGQTAKALYEQGRVNKEDLREIVVEQMRGTGQAEKLLAERLKPLRSSETMERMPREAGQAGTDGGASGGGAASAPADARQTYGNPKEPIDVSAAADALIAQQAAKEHKSENYSVGWIALAIVVITLVLGFLLF